MKKYKGFIIVSLLIVLSDIIFIFLNYQAAIETLNDDIRDWATQIEKVFKIELNSKATSMQQLAAFVANNPKISGAFKKGKEALLLEGGGKGKEKSAAYRKQLLDLLLPSWKKMTAMYDVRQLHFHLGPGSTSFLRVHRPEKFGDNMDDVRHTVVDVNNTAQPSIGFETGRVYSGIRGVVPVFHNDEDSGEVQFVGALEAGTSFAVLLESMQHGIECDVCILLNKEHVQKNMWPAFIERHFEPARRVGRFFIEGSTHADVNRLLVNKTIMSLLNTGGATIVGENNPIQVGVFPLRDYRGTIYPHLPDSGSVIFWKDATKRWNLFRRTFFNNIVFSILALLVVETMLFLVWKFSREKLQVIIDQKTQEIGESYTMNQPLMAISGFVELLAMDGDVHVRSSKNVTKIKALIERMGTITKKLMHITRYETKDYLDRKIIDLDSAADSELK